ncbi:hypothetical protein SSPS47_12420 [Streptomyces sp. S4.7]|uniref:hypothetical protein n=1 Tax=Streptomyces sp. S4.7 TaxID=2705439 RepID=UPI001397BC33|nr:hypothetical protein [Streptomyces sp. S4.7]QHY95923.1 hypothetical protein SSPS47_12420 [Streptomyces sp. S4.7]
MPGIDACLHEIMALPGARGAAIVDWTSGLALGTAGESPGGDHETTATETAELARAAAEYPAFAPAAEPVAGPAGADATREAAGDGKGPPVEDLIVTSRTGYHVLRFVETTFDSSVFLHLWLDRDTGNLALARLRLQQLAERLVLA